MTALQLLAVDRYRSRQPYPWDGYLGCTSYPNETLRPADDRDRALRALEAFRSELHTGSDAARRKVVFSLPRRCGRKSFCSYKERDGASSPSPASVSVSE